MNVNHVSIRQVTPNVAMLRHWEIVASDGKLIATRPTKEEAEAFADGYNFASETA